MDNNGLHRITLGSLFDGIGGFPFCAELSGVAPVWAAEIDPACVAVTKHRFPDMLHYGDVSKINGAEIPPVDIITFGSPCQDLSVAGKRKGIKHKDKGDEETTRSGLFVEAIRIIYEMRRATNGLYPAFIVWENVPGTFSSHDGRDFQAVLEEITKTDIPMPTSGRWANAGVVRGGTIHVAWRVFDAQYWGIPQRRKRIYLVGSFGSDCAERILFKRDSVRKYLAPREKERETASADIGTGIEERNFVFDCRGNGDGETVQTMTGDHNSRVSDYTTVVCFPKTAHTLAARHDGSPQPDKGNGANIVCYPKIIAGFNGQNSVTAGGVELHEELSPTLTAKKNANVLYSAGFKAGNGAKARGTGYHEETSPTLSAAPSGTNQAPGVVYALQGSMIGREEKNGPQGDGINENVCFTLNTSDRHCVAFKNSSFGGYSEGVGTLRATQSKRPEENVIVDLREWIVRRLIPLECERLQGYPEGWTVLPKIKDMSKDEYEFFKAAFMLDKEIRGKPVKRPPTKQQIIHWYNKLDVDGTRYRQLGNSLAIPCALRVVGYIADYIREERAEYGI